MSTKVKAILIAATAALILASAACAPGPTAPSWTSDGSFEFAIDDGTTIVTGGGPVRLHITGETPIPLYDTECYTAWETGRHCSRSYDASLTPQAGFVGEIGTWVAEFSTMRACNMLSESCNPLEFGVDKLRASDGSEGVTVPLGSDLGDGGTFIEDTDGCSGTGVKFEGTGQLQSNPSASVGISLVICSPGLAAHMAATQNPYP